MIHPRYRVVAEGAPVSQALTPVYPTTSGLAQDALRRLIARALADGDLSDTLPETILEKLQLPPFGESVTLLHNPPPEIPRAMLPERRHPAWRRVKFDELLAQQLSMRQHYRRRKAVGAPALRPRGQAARALAEMLPFELTRAQHKALAEIRGDLAR